MLIFTGEGILGVRVGVEAHSDGTIKVEILLTAVFPARPVSCIHSVSQRKEHGDGVNITRQTEADA